MGLREEKKQATRAAIVETALELFRERGFDDTRIQDITDFIIHKTNGPVRVNWYDNVWLRVVGSKLVWLAWRVGPMV